VAVATTAKTTGRRIEFFHISPHANIQQLRARWHHRFEGKGLFVAPSYGAIIGDWFGYVASKKHAKQEEQGRVHASQMYKSLTVYRLGVPQPVRDACMGIYEQSPHGFLYKGRVRNGFRDWGDELWIPEEYLEQVIISGRTTISYEDLVREYQRPVKESQAWFAARNNTTSVARRITKTNRVARLYLQLIEELQRLRMKGASLPEYLPAWLEGFRKYFFEDDGPGLKHRVSEDEFGEAKNLGNKLRNLFFPRMIPRTKASE
jgi:hypothetical protein